MRTSRFAGEIRRDVASGSPDVVDIPQQSRAYRRRPIEDRFWEKVDKTSSASGCWLWLGAKEPHGYGSFNIGNRTNRAAHRVAYLLTVGPIPSGMTLDHLCRNTSCVNPAHLDPCTSGVNTSRGTSPGANAVRTNRCCRGHEFTPENTYFRPDNGHRFCRQCIAIRKGRAT